MERPRDPFASRFQIEALAGAGGMGEVHRALDLQSGARVAVKIAHARPDLRPDRMAREAESLASLTHPGFARYVAHGITDDGRWYLAMEWIEGETLSARLSRQPLHIAEVAALGARLADALSAAHTQGLVHRDVKPSNILLPAGRIAEARLVDLGIVRVRGAERLTATGAIIGTIGYMPPEQARGDASVGPHSDVYAVGAVMFEALTGRRPFEGDEPMMILLKTALEDAPLVRSIRPDVPEALDALVARMLAREPGQRPGAREVAGELRALTPGNVAPGPPSLPRGLTGTERRVVCLVLGRPAGGAALPVEALRAACVRFGAHLSQLADGSAVAALSEAGAATDLAARAARCALAFQALLGGRVALATGRSEVGERWKLDELLGRARALLAAGEAARVGLDETTAGLLDAGFEVSAAPPSYTLIAERDTEGAGRTLLGKATPFVGRVHEMSMLRGLFEACAGEPRATAALVTAAPGMGKSRLREELIREARASRPDLEVWLGRGDSMSAGSPFGLIAQALRRAAGIRGGEPLEACRARLRARAGMHLPEEDAGRVARFLGELAGIPFADDDAQLLAARHNPALMGDQMRRAFEDLVAAECEAHPLLLVLEDLHWGDRPTVDLVDGVLAQLVDRPLMVLALGRPEVRAQFPNLWADRRASVIHLGELGRKDGEELVCAALGEAHRSRAAALVERAGGNAFYIEELIRAVAEGRDAALPETVLAMAQARIEGLDAGDRRLLRAASVFGRAFWGGGLCALLGAERASVEARLDDLTRRELLVRRRDARFPGEREHAFRHALVREAAYAMLADGDRAAGHALAGAWLERCGETDAVALAEHFERGGNLDRAANWYRAAAAKALEGNDLDTVIALVDRGVRAGAREDLLGELRCLEAEAHSWRARYAESEARAVDALVALPLGHPSRRMAIATIAVASVQLGHPDRLPVLEREIVAAPAGEERNLAWLTAAGRVALGLLYAGRAEAASPLLDRLGEAERSLGDDPAALAVIHRVYATRASCRGESSLMHQLASAHHAERAGNRRLACAARGNAGYALLKLGAYAEAEAALRSAIADAGRLGLDNLVAAARSNLGLVLACCGRLDEGRALQEEAIVAFRAQGDARLEGAARAYLARILVFAGAFDAAEREALTAVEVIGGASPAIRAQALAVVAEARLRSGRVAEALAAVEEAFRLAEAVGGTLEDGDGVLRVVRAETLLAAGRHAEARAALLDAVARIEARAEKIADPAQRAGFLDRVPEHARARALARR